MTPRLMRYMRTNESRYDKAVSKWITEQLTTPKPDRSGRFGASSGGSCARAQVYGYLGVAGFDVDSDLAAIFNNGTWSHLRMQADLLQAGIIDDIEVSTADMKSWRSDSFPMLRGTMDGVGTVPLDHPKDSWAGKRFGLEFKTANSFVYNLMQHQVEPAEKYYSQVARYFIATNLDLIVVLVEDKNTQSLIESVIERRKLSRQIDEQAAELTALQMNVLNAELPAQLPACRLAKGDDFRQCSYGASVRNACHTLVDFNSAAGISTSSSKKIKIVTRRESRQS